MKITQKDIAMAADVSITTVSMALKNSPQIHEQTKEKILDAAKRLNYNLGQLSNLKPKRVKHNIGLLIDTSAANSHIWNFLRIMIESLSKEVQSHDSTFILLPISPSQNKENILKMIERANVSGIISFMYSEESILIDIETQGIPVILTFNEQRTEGFFYVGQDDFQGAYEATKYLLNLNHRKIAYVYTERNNLPFLLSNRFVGYKKALNEWGIDIEPELTIHYDQNNFKTFTKKIIKSLNSNNAPTSYLCLDDDIASILYHTLTSNNYKIPEDLSIIAHGDSLDYSNPINPQITTMRTDIELSANICCSLLFNRFEEPEKSYSSIKTREVLIDRGSCIEYKL